MRKLSPLSLVALLVILLAGGWWLLQQPAPTDFPSTGAADTGPMAAIKSVPGTSTDRSEALPSFLPREAHRTLALIARGGPFPYPQDGGVFGNREGHLPKQPRGYYREFTVDTPGLSHRGARRIITGGKPPDIYYYTDDHYDSFRSFMVTP